jgi:cyclopropane fatty-acyl-phospholipid synthase-like methyltransferase
MHDFFALEKSKNYQKKIYTKLFDKYKGGHRAFHWSSKRAQYRRFEILLADIDRGTLLDIGCGEGDLWNFIVQCEKDISYVGIDIVKASILSAQRKYKSRALFYQSDFLSSSYKREHDYIVMSGLFAFGNELFFKKMVEKAYEHVNKMVVFNLFRAKENSDFFSISHTKVIEFLEMFNPKQIETQCDYLDGDCTYFLIKR